MDISLGCIYILHEDRDFVWKHEDFVWRQRSHMGCVNCGIFFSLLHIILTCSFLKLELSVCIKRVHLVEMMLEPSMKEKVRP